MKQNKLKEINDIVPQQDTLFTLLLLCLSTQVYKWGPGRDADGIVVSWHVWACQMVTGRNAPQGVEKVHSECRLDSEFYDRGNNTL